MKEEVSVFCWIKLVAHPNVHSSHILNRDEEFGFLVRSSTGFRVVLTDNSGAVVASQTDKVSVFNNKNWHLVGFTYDGTTLDLFVDGKLTSTSRGTVSIKNLVDSFAVGNHIEQPRPLKGYVDDIKIYNRVLSEEMVAILYKN